MTSTQQLQSTYRENGFIDIAMTEVALGSPASDEVIVRIEATPINPSDLGTLTGPADLQAAENITVDGKAILRAPVKEEHRSALAARVEKPLPIGNEGAGVVVEAGDSEMAQALLGKTVAVLGGAMYAQHRKISAKACLVLPEGTTPRQGASCFVNPLTALGMVETMRLENHKALVHTAAASNLGQMLNKLCLSESVPLVNIVRSEAQGKLLADIGATVVCDSTKDSFMADLCEAINATGATLAFDAIGGGHLASNILTAMERVYGANAKPSDRYGSTVHKQVYSYGFLDTSPTILERNYGMAWGVGGWLLTAFLQRVGGEKAQALREKVAKEITTTFASDYTDEISLEQVIDVDIARRYQRKSTGDKFLINPSIGS